MTLLVSIMDDGLDHVRWHVGSVLSCAQCYLLHARGIINFTPVCEAEPWFVNFKEKQG